MMPPSPTKSDSTILDLEGDDPDFLLSHSERVVFDLKPPLFEAIPTTLANEFKSLSPAKEGPNEQSQAVTALALVMQDRAAGEEEEEHGRRSKRSEEVRFEVQEEEEEEEDLNMKVEEDGQVLFGEIQLPVFLLREDEVNVLRLDEFLPTTKMLFRVWAEQGTSELDMAESDDEGELCDIEDVFSLPVEMNDFQKETQDLKLGCFLWSIPVKEEHFKLNFTETESMQKQASPPITERPIHDTDFGASDMSMEVSPETQHVERKIATTEEPPTNSTDNNEWPKQLPEINPHKAQFNALEIKWGLTIDESEQDPATFRSQLRTITDSQPNELFRTVTLHLLSVCRSLLASEEDQEIGKAYLLFCEADPGYRRVLGGVTNDIFADLNVMLFAIKHYSADNSATSSTATRRPKNDMLDLDRRAQTTIVVDATQRCASQEIHKLVRDLEQKETTVVVERDLDERITFQLDETSAIVVVTFPIQGGSAGTAKWASETAKWLVFEAHKFRRIWILATFTRAPDAAARTAMRNISTAVSTLSAPAPMTKIRFALSRERAAQEIRRAINECAGEDPEWYHKRDGMPENVGGEYANQIKLLRQFPGITALQAEAVVHQESAAEFLRRQGGPVVDAFLGPELAPSEQQQYSGGDDTYMQEEAPFIQQMEEHHNYEEEQQQELSPTLSAMRRKRALGYNKAAGGQTKLTWKS